MLLEGGVNLAEALDIVVKTINNKILTKALNEARENIVKQGKIAQYLKQTKVFPPIAIYLIQTGEQTGQLDKMLLTIAENYQADSLELTDRLTAALNPLMLVVMGLLVGFIVVSLAPILIPT
jgi:type II secretory pathway component PulF